MGAQHKWVEGTEMRRGKGVRWDHMRLGFTGTMDRMGQLGKQRMGRVRLVIRKRAAHLFLPIQHRAASKQLLTQPLFSPKSLKPPNPTPRNTRVPPPNHPRTTPRKTAHRFVSSQFLLSLEYLTQTTLKRTTRTDRRFRITITQELTQTPLFHSENIHSTGSSQLRYTLYTCRCSRYTCSPMRRCVRRVRVDGWVMAGRLAGRMTDG